MQDAGYKRCPACGEIKPSADFPRNRAKPDGLNNYCKPCSYEKVRAYRAAYPEAYRATQRTQTAKWNAKNPERTREIRRARRAVFNAIRRGDLERPTVCSACGAEDRRIYGHHPDHSKVLEVVWLCPPCHYAADHPQ